LIILRELLNFNKHYKIKGRLLNTLKPAPKVPVDITKFVVAAENWFVICGRL
jgi:hypothetical protein